MTTSKKTCRKCGAEKPFVDYYKHSQMGDGHLNICKPCTRARITNERNENIEKHRERDRKRGYREYDPKKTQARRAVRQLSRPDDCSTCKAVGPVEGHHEDYDKPLDVIWLCKPCHTAVHFF